jgi:hypothetical protein
MRPFLFDKELANVAFFPVSFSGLLGEKMVF